MTQTAIPLPLYDEELPYRRRLFEENQHFARFMVRRHYGFLGGADYDDAVQEALFVLARAVRRWDPSHGVALTTYAGKSIKRHLRVWFMRLQRCGATGCDDYARLRSGDQFVSPVSPPVSLDAELRGGITISRLVEFEDENGPMEPKVCADALARRIDRLPDPLRRLVVMRYVDEMTLQEIGEATGTSRQNVEQRCKRALAMIRGSSEPEEFYQ